MRCWAAVAFVLALAGIGGWAKSGQAAQAPATAKVSGNVADKPEVSNGVVQAELSSINAYFLVDTKNLGQRSKALALLEQARHESREVVFVFDPSSGAVDVSSSTPFFRILELDYGKSRLIIDSTPTGAAPQGASGAAAKTVAAGLGLQYSGDWDGAKSDLRSALADTALSPAIRVLAFDSLGSMALDEGEGEYQQGSTESDRLLMEALADFRAEQAEAPYSVAPKVGIANVLFDLGAYDQTLTAFKDLAEHAESQAYWANIALGYVHRTMGEYDQSLQVLDDLARKQGPMTGMPFYYHRGLTLLAMGRDAEAADEFTAGLKFQPDYSWAMISRACAHGRLGRLGDALTDMRRASDLQAQIVYEKTLPRDTYNMARTAAILQELSAAVAAGKPTRSDAACKGFWPDSYTRRSRSPMLPKIVSDGPNTSA